MTSVRYFHYFCFLAPLRLGVTVTVNLSASFTNRIFLLHTSCLLIFDSWVFRRYGNKSGWRRFGTPCRFLLHTSSETNITICYISFSWLVKMEPITSSETSSDYLIHTPCKNPITIKYYSGHGESLKTRLILASSRVSSFYVTCDFVCSPLSQLHVLTD